MRVVFMGTPAFAADILVELAQQHEVVAVYTRPDAVRGRGARQEASPVKAVAEKLGLDVYAPQSLRDEQEQQTLKSLAPDVICVAAYGMILPKSVLGIPHYGCLNVHASLLPRWRGAAPIERAILAGDAQAGVCIMRMEEGLDTGAYCVRRATDIADKSAKELTDELANLGARALLTGLSLVEQNGAEWIEQDESQATYADKLGKSELFPSARDTAVVFVRKVCASSDAHPSRCVLAERTVSLLRAAVASDGSSRELCAGIASGEVRFVAKRLFLGVADGAVEVFALKPDGKKEMDARSFAAGIQGIKRGGYTWRALDD